jgi:hypothetical protein
MEIERSRSERSRRARGRAMQRREPCPTKKRGVFRWCVCWPNGAKTNRKRSLRLYLQPSEAILPPANVLSQEGLSTEELAIFGMRSRDCKFIPSVVLMARDRWISVLLVGESLFLSSNKTCVIDGCHHSAVGTLPSDIPAAKAQKATTDRRRCQPRFGGRSPQKIRDIL